MTFSASTILTSLRDLQRRIHTTALGKGWWDDEEAIIQTLHHATEPPGALTDALIAHINAGKMCLMHSEISEALEGERKPGSSDKIPAFRIQEEELADAIIRAFDLAQRRGWNLPEAILAKMEYNEGRDHRHGGKRL